jgi:hypothetical protein
MKSLLFIVLIILGVYLLTLPFALFTVLIEGGYSNDSSEFFIFLLIWVFGGISFYLIKKKINTLDDDYVSLFFKVHVFRAKDSIDRSKKKLKSELSNREDPGEV